MYLICYKLMWVAAYVIPWKPCKFKGQTIKVYSSFIDNYKGDPWCKCLVISEMYLSHALLIVSIIIMIILMIFCSGLWLKWRWGAVQKWAHKLFSVIYCMIWDAAFHSGGNIWANTSEVFITYLKLERYLPFWWMPLKEGKGGSITMPSI